MCGIYKIALYTVLLCAVDGEILLLPVRVRHVEKWRITFKPTIFVNVTWVIHSHSRLQQQNQFFPTYKRPLYRPVAKKPEVDIIMLSLASETQVIR